ncbi:MAG: NUDIX hydrolase [Nanoarchaeota archaeon]
MNGKESVEVVSGAIDEGEKPINAAKRELEEELGIQAEEWLDLGRVDPFTSVVHSPAYLFLARKLKFTKRKQEGTEKIRCNKIPLQDAIKMVIESKITHGPSCVLILKAQDFLRSSEK